MQPEPRALFQKLLRQGWVDAIREIHPDAPMYTFWDFKRRRWERDAGLRIDHLLLNAKAAKRLVDAGVNREVRGLEGASDHAPAWVVLRDAKTRQKSSRRVETQKPQKRKAAKRAAPAVRRPLLVIDGDSFAHRSYHALPKTIRGRGGKPAGAILGFANMLLRLYREEQPRAVLVAIGTKRCRLIRAAASSMRSCSSNSTRCRNSLRRAGSRMRKHLAMRRTISWHPLPRPKRGVAGQFSSQAATAILSRP